MKCIFCENELPPIGASETQRHFLCQHCQSYYYYIAETGEYYTYNAYPDKNIKKYFESRHIRLPKGPQ